MSRICLSPPRQWLMFWVGSRIIKRFDFIYEIFFYLNEVIRYRIFGTFHQFTTFVKLGYFSCLRSYSRCFSQFEKNFCLPFFDSQIRQNIIYQSDTFFICKENRVQGLTVNCIWFFNSPISTINRVNQINYFRGSLFYSTSFRICWIPGIFNNSNRICVSFNCKIPVRIHCSSDVGECNFIHKI